MGPVTTNPWLISIINMTIVFGVLAALGVLMKIIQLVDPTQKKTEKPVAAPAPAAAPAAVAAPGQDDSEVIAVFASAVAALNTQGIGGRSPLPSLDQVHKLMGLE